MTKVIRFWSFCKIWNIIDNILSLTFQILQKYQIFIELCMEDIKDRQLLIARIMQWWSNIGSDILWLNNLIVSCKPL